MSACFILYKYESGVEVKYDHGTPKTIKLAILLPSTHGFQTNTKVAMLSCLYQCYPEQKQSQLCALLYAELGFVSLSIYSNVCDRKCPPMPKAFWDCLLELDNILRTLEQSSFSPENWLPHWLYVGASENSQTTCIIFSLYPNSSIL